MKKLLFAFAILMGSVLVSCNTKTTDSTDSADSTTTDSVVTDTVATDSVM